MEGFLDAAPTTAAPKVIVINLNNDTRLGELSEATEKITNKLTDIDRTFELASTLGNRAELAKLLATIKELRTENNHLHIEITIELATRLNVNAHFLNRLSLEMLRIQAERADKYFKWIHSKKWSPIIFGKLGEIPNLFGQVACPNILGHLIEYKRTSLVQL